MGLFGCLFGQEQKEKEHDGFKRMQAHSLKMLQLKLSGCKHVMPFLGSLEAIEAYKCDMCEEKKSKTKEEQSTMGFKIGDTVEINGNKAQIITIRYSREERNYGSGYFYINTYYVLRFDSGKELEISDKDYKELPFKPVKDQKEPDFKIGEVVGVMSVCEDNCECGRTGDLKKYNGQAGKLLKIHSNGGFPFGVKFHDGTVLSVAKIEKLIQEPAHKFNAGDKDIELNKTETPKFKVGDRVKYTGTCWVTIQGREGVIDKTCTDKPVYSVKIKDGITEFSWYLEEKELVLVERVTENIKSKFKVGQKVKILSKARYDSLDKSTSELIDGLSIGAVIKIKAIGAITVLLEDENWYAFDQVEFVEESDEHDEPKSETKKPDLEQILLAKNHCKGHTISWDIEEALIKITRLDDTILELRIPLEDIVTHAKSLIECYQHTVAQKS